MNKEKQIKKGDFVMTPRFLYVRIEEVFNTEEDARNAGFTEPTHYVGEYSVLGKSHDMYHMSFAAVKPQH